ncbi:unnamed protein product [Urochloa humidicola]
MPLGSTLSPGSNSAAPWTSPNNTFSLSFTASPTSTSLFIAAITYVGGVPVWFTSNVIGEQGLRRQPFGISQPLECSSQ